jgi:hypothetical protein
MRRDVSDSLRHQSCSVQQPGTSLSLLHKRLWLIVDCRASRNTALLQLAAEAPTAAVADLLGLNASTAATK